MNKIWIDSYAYHVHLALFPIFDSELTFFDPKMTFYDPLMTSDDLKMHTIEFRRKFPIDLYAYYVDITYI